MSSPPLPIAPVADIAVVPSSYRIILRKNICTHCGDSHTTLEAYALARIRTTDPRNSGHITHLIPITEFRYNVPTSFVWGAAIHAPRCIECLNWHVKTGFDTNLSHLPSPPPPPRTVVAVHQEAEAKPKPSLRSHSLRAHPTLTDLLADL